MLSPLSTPIVQRVQQNTIVPSNADRSLRQHRRRVWALLSIGAQHRHITGNPILPQRWATTGLIASTRRPDSHLIAPHKHQKQRSL